MTKQYAEIPYELILVGHIGCFAYVTKCPFVGGKYVGAPSCKDCQYHRANGSKTQIVICSHPQNFV